MNTQQQAALEALVGRAITTDEVAQIDAFMAAGRLNEVTALLSAGRTKWVPFEIGNGTVLQVFGLAKGNAVLDIVYTDSTFRYVKPLMEQGRLRLDVPMTRATLEALVGSVITQADLDAMYALCTVDDPLTDAQVQAALEA